MRRPSLWCEKPIVLPAMLCLLILALVGCGKPFRVPTQVRSGSEPLAAQTTINSLTVEATAITDEDALMQLFNANLILARILVIRLMLRNQSREPVTIHRLKFDLRTAQDHKFEFLKPRKAVRALYDYYEIGTYRIAAREAVEADFEREALHMEAALEPGEERQGLVFFRIPEAVDNLGPLEALTLRLERLRWAGSDQDTAVELRLTAGR